MNDTSQNQWNEDNSQVFIDYGRYFVPQREMQIQTITELVPQPDLGKSESFEILELCCGEGLLAEALLIRYPGASYSGLDGSSEMLRRAAARLDLLTSRERKTASRRYQLSAFDLASRDWRAGAPRYQAVVSSLAVHHLDDEQKQALFGDVHAMLNPGGALLIADIIQPSHHLGWELAAAAWDAAVKQRVQQMGNSQGGWGEINPYEFFEREGWNTFRYFDPEDIDKPSPLFDQLKWLEQAGFSVVDVFWMEAGHAIFGGYK
jgi:tRNA (cmo5U34)-methyltransferase